MDVEGLEADTPVNVSIYRDGNGVLSSVWSMNLVTEDFRSHSNRRNICFRMSDKFELLIDGCSYNIDEMIKK